MPAYFIVDLDIRAPISFQAYARAVGPVVEKFGARSLVAAEAGNVVEVLEGDWAPRKITVIEFPSRARAKEFFGSPEFREIVGRVGEGGGRPMHQADLPAWPGTAPSGARSVGCFARVVRVARPRPEEKREQTEPHRDSELGRARGLGTLVKLPDEAEPLGLDAEGDVELRAEVLEGHGGGELDYLRLAEVRAHPGE
jgi:uncharacterized protein (DUF1330 family)